MSPNALASPPDRSAARGGAALPNGEAIELSAEDAARVHVLVVDDEYTVRDSCASVLRQAGYSVQVCSSGEEALEVVQRRRVDVVLIDFYMEGMSGLETLSALLEARPELVAIMMTGNPSVASSVAALQSGAWDYLPKPFSATHLHILIGRAAHQVLSGGDGEGTEAPERAAVSDHSDKVPLIGRSPAFLEAVDLARKVAATDASVFITGESGTGKELVAQFIHHHSRRSTRPMVAVNCAALPETLLESEMFGHCKGSFTGAIKDKRGLLETADGGTFFLDELTEMSQTIQAKLLRVIQDGVVRRVGSETTDATVNVRFVAACNRDPHKAVEEGVLRKDLFYRLSVVPIRLPPLRERVEDVEPLAEHFLRLYWKRHRGGAAAPTLSRAAVRSLEQRPWRGNVRELQNVMEHAVVLLEPGTEVQPDDLPFLEGETPVASSMPRIEEAKGEKYHTARDRILADFERVYLTWLVERAGANMSRAAKIAGVDRTTLYRLMEKHGMQRDTIIKSDG